MSNPGSLIERCSLTVCTIWQSKYSLGAPILDTTNNSIGEPPMSACSWFSTETGRLSASILGRHTANRVIIGPLSIRSLGMEPTEVKHARTAFPRIIRGQIELNVLLTRHLADRWLHRDTAGATPRNPTPYPSLDRFHPAICNYSPPRIPIVPYVSPDVESVCFSESEVRCSFSSPHI